MSLCSAHYFGAYSTRVSRVQVALHYKAKFITDCASTYGNSSVGAALLLAQT